MRPVTRYACIAAVASLSVSWLGGCNDGTEAADEQRELSSLRESPDSIGADPFINRTLETAADGVAEVDDALTGSDGGGAASSDAGAAQQDADVAYSDGELLGIVVAIHDAGSTFGSTAEPELTDPRLASLARDVAAAHREGLRRALSLGILPAPSKSSNPYVEGGEGLWTSLRDEERGEPFDRAYLEYQIMFSGMIAHQLDSEWLPVADRAELKEELTITRDTMQEHVDRGIALREELFPEGSDVASDEDAEEADGMTTQDSDRDGEADDNGEADDAGSRFGWPVRR